MTGGQIRFDTGPLGDGTLFRAPQAIIRADSAAGVGPALAAMQAATERGCWLAGYLSYELGHALIPRLAGLMPADRRMPLILMGVFDGPHPADPLPSPDGVAIGAVRPLWDRARYDAAIATVHGLIESGDTYQINLTFPLQAEVEGDPLAIYAALAARQPVGEGAFVDLGGPVVLSRSPELFFAVDADRRITTRPMKGTAARGDTPANDAQAAQALHGSAKNRAENLMIVDLLRNDISRICLPGTVRVPQLFHVETYATVHQMVSTVQGQLAPDAGLAQILAALFPCGSITGAPKVRSMQIIAELEGAAREVYCGAIGWVDPAGPMRFSVAIRSPWVETPGMLRLNVGGGIVHDSQAGSEWEEALCKAAFLGRSPTA
ncbi:aminodeoxychorismate synthase component I [Paracoccus marcusii]|uniref:Aminodeoxychorismate synthase component I n=2 Tax=Pseudomonadota TaxID=1224 RepID=A0ABY7USH1_9RHOB|nr:aminodeoxychorismate synthase component I [Paracoccus marcusii]WDA12889.1 aminodeoxychorismate synthase component I [Paracoccus marcusii]